MNEAKETLEHGDKYPYDAIYDEEWDKSVAPEGDWAVRAARGVIVELVGRNGLDDVLQNIDTDTKAEIIQAMAGIIREAIKPDPVHQERAAEGKCPVCGEDANFGSVDIEGNNAVQEGSCACGAEFHNVYEFSNTVIEEPEEK